MKSKELNVEDLKIRIFEAVKDGDLPSFQHFLKEFKEYYIDYDFSKLFDAGGLNLLETALESYNKKEHFYTDWLTIVRLLLIEGVKISDELRYKFLMNFIVEGHQGYRGNVVDIIKALLKGVAEKSKFLNAFHHNGATLLTEAAYWGVSDIVNVLIQSGADPMFANRNGELPIYFACVRGNTDVVKILLKHAFAGKSQEEIDKMRFELLMAAIDKDSRDPAGVIDALLEGVAEKSKFLNAFHDNGATLLTEAAYYGVSEAVDILLKLGADPMFESESKALPIYFACEQGHKEVVKILLEYISDRNLAIGDNLSKLGRSFSTAIQKGFVDIFRCFLTYIPKITEVKDNYYHFSYKDFIDDKSMNAIKSYFGTTNGYFFDTSFFLQYLEVASGEWRSRLMIPSYGQPEEGDRDKLWENKIEIYEDLARLGLTMVFIPGLRYDGFELNCSSRFKTAFSAAIRGMVTSNTLEITSHTESPSDNIIMEFKTPFKIAILSFVHLLDKETATFLAATLPSEIASDFIELYDARNRLKVLLHQDEGVRDEEKIRHTAEIIAKHLSKFNYSGCDVEKNVLIPFLFKDCMEKLPNKVKSSFRVKSQAFKEDTLIDSLIKMQSEILSSENKDSLAAGQQSLVIKHQTILMNAKIKECFKEMMEEVFKEDLDRVIEKKLIEKYSKRIIEQNSSNHKESGNLDSELDRGAIICLRRIRDELIEKFRAKGDTKSVPSLISPEKRADIATCAISKQYSKIQSLQGLKILEYLSKSFKHNPVEKVVEVYLGSSSDTDSSRFFRHIGNENNIDFKFSTLLSKEDIEIAMKVAYKVTIKPLFIVDFERDGTPDASMACHPTVARAGAGTSAGVLDRRYAVQTARVEEASEEYRGGGVQESKSYDPEDRTPGVAPATALAEARRHTLQQKTKPCIIS